ncbi:MAG: hypothetical protein GY765_41445 [bacterium]|nr:hypothetical protein [bacterium]
MTEIDQVYELKRPIKGWPVRKASNLQEAAEMIFGSPYWELPEDRYVVLDNNETYSILAVVSSGRASLNNRYMVVNMDFVDNSRKIVE